MTSSLASELATLDARAQSDLIRRREVTAVELASAAIECIEAGNLAINAVIAPLFERALERAAAVDGAGAGGPLAGVPMLMKDAGQELEGTPHWVGTSVLHRAGHRSPATTSLAARMEAAGLVVLGKTNLPELSAGATTEPAEFGPTRNPYDVERTAGGSSGGSAAAVAAGWVAVAHGGDATGSLRFPASACGLFTLKPSRGRIPSLSAAGMEDDGQVWTEGVLTRTARDLAACFSVLADDPRPVPLTAPGPLRVGVLIDDVVTGLEAHEECRAAVERVGAALERLGHHVEVNHPAALDGLFARVAPAFVVASQHGRATQVRWIGQRIGRAVVDGDLDARTLELAEQGAVLTRDEVARSSADLTAAMNPVLDWWRDHDLLVTPTMRTPPWRLGRPNEAIYAGGYAMTFSFTGQPALNVPAHRTAGGLPVGVQIVGAPGHDELLLALAADLESA